MPRNSFSSMVGAGATSPATDSGAQGEEDGLDDESTNASLRLETSSLTTWAGLLVRPAGPIYLRPGRILVGCQLLAETTTSAFINKNGRISR